MTSSLTLRLIVGFLVVYFLVGAAIYGRTPADELYPFFSWSLFKDVPQRTMRINTLRITAVDGKELERPLLHTEAREFFDEERVDNANYLFHELAQALEMGDDAVAADMRRRIEQGLPPGTHYDLVEMDIGTIEFWKSREAVETRVLRSFTSD